MSSAGRAQDGSAGSAQGGSAVSAQEQGGSAGSAQDGSAGSAQDGRAGSAQEQDGSAGSAQRGSAGRAQDGSAGSAQDDGSQGSAQAGSDCQASSRNPASRENDCEALNLVLAPHSSAERVDYVAVQMTLQAPSAKAGEAYLLAPLKLPDVDGPGYDPASLQITDSQGAVPFTTEADEIVILERDSAGDLSIRYNAPAYVVTTGAFPPFELRAEGRSALGAGNAFLFAPLRQRTYHMHIAWDLSNMPAGSLGVWAFGEGTVDHVGPIEHLTESYFGMGPLYSHTDGAFGLYWASDPPFNAQAMGRSAHSLFLYYVEFFKNEIDSYRAFLRQNRYSASAAALNQSFLYDYSSESVDLAFMTNTLAHEMTHTFIAPWDEEGWYVEGVANHYGGVLSVRTGVATPDEFLVEVNKDAQQYYASPVRSISVASATAANAAGDPDGDIAIFDIFYGRSRLYLASVNAKIRKQSGGLHSLDDVTRALEDRRLQGQLVSEAEWLKLVEAELGAQGREDHEAFLAGDLVAPDADAFGPCFERQRADVPQFDLGFDRAILLANPSIVKGLRQGSPGDKAGLLENDEIISADVGRSYSDPAATVTLRVQRGARTIEITYVPRGETMLEAYRWNRVTTMPDDACGI